MTPEAGKKPEGRTGTGFVVYPDGSWLQRTDHGSFHVQPLRLERCTDCTTLRYTHECKSVQEEVPVYTAGAPVREEAPDGSILLSPAQRAMVMDALESDANIDQRRAAFEMIQKLCEPTASAARHGHSALGNFADELGREEALRSLLANLLARIENGQRCSIGSIDNVRRVDFGIDDIERLRVALTVPAPLNRREEVSRERSTTPAVVGASGAWFPRYGGRS